MEFISRIFLKSVALLGLDWLSVFQEPRECANCLRFPELAESGRRASTMPMMACDAVEFGSKAG